VIRCKLGKAKPRRDTRNFRFASLLRKTFDPPAAYDADPRRFPGRMFANDTYGDCVIAGRAHQTLRFEWRETGKLPRIYDRDVLREYLAETGGGDDGLVVLDSLNLWRRQGWRAGGRVYTIQAFAELARSPLEVKRAMCLDLGVGLGLWLPTTAAAEFKAGRPWTDTSGRPGGWGGHYAYAVAYDAAGVTCMTWGQRQAMSWAFFAKYCDECYGIIDAMDAKKSRALDAARLRVMLRRVG
jgi:hypothetical protein